MIYILDTSAFIVLNHFYPKTFATLWKEMDALVANRTIRSVKEVYNELFYCYKSEFINDWANKHKKIFYKPSNDELNVVKQILAIPNFQSIIGSKAILKGTPVADPFIVAAGVVIQATVVTQEKNKPNSSKLPTVCAHFKVSCINLEDFMKQQGWSF
jgi:hypothetical protein